MTIGIREIREAKNLTQQQIAERAGISRPFLVDLEYGRRGAKEETWERIAAALGVTVDVLKGEKLPTGETDQH